MKQGTKIMNANKFNDDVPMVDQEFDMFFDDYNYITSLIKDSSITELTIA